MRSMCRLSLLGVLPGGAGRTPHVVPGPVEHAGQHLGGRLGRLGLERRSVPQDHHLLGQLESAGPSPLGADRHQRAGHPLGHDRLELDDRPRIDDLSALDRDQVLEDVQVPGLAEAVPVPGQLGPQRGAPGGVEEEPEGPQVGSDATHGHPALVDPFGLGLPPLAPVQFAGGGFGPHRSRRHQHVERTQGLGPFGLVHQFVAHVVQQEGPGRAGQDTVEHHARRGTGELVVVIDARDATEVLHGRSGVSVVCR